MRINSDAAGSNNYLAQVPSGFSIPYYYIAGCDSFRLCVPTARTDSRHGIIKNNDGDSQ